MKKKRSYLKITFNKTLFTESKHLVMKLPWHSCTTIYWSTFSVRNNTEELVVVVVEFMVVSGRDTARVPTPRQEND